VYSAGASIERTTSVSELRVGDTVAVSRAYGSLVGIVAALPAGHVTLDAGNHRVTFELSRRTVKVIK